MPYKTISKLHGIALIISWELPFKLPYQNFPTRIESGKVGKLLVPCDDNYMSAVLAVSRSANSM